MFTYEGHVPVNHWTRGGTGVTNFDADMLPVYQEAILRYGDPDLRIHNKRLADEREGFSLHIHSRKRDLSAFWEVFRQVEGEQGQG